MNRSVRSWLFSVGALGVACLGSPSLAQAGNVPCPGDGNSVSCTHIVHQYSGTNIYTMSAIGCSDGHSYTVWGRRSAGKWSVSCTSATHPITTAAPKPYLALDSYYFNFTPTSGSGVFAIDLDPAQEAILPLDLDPYASLVPVESPYSSTFDQIFAPDSGSGGGGTGGGTCGPTQSGGGGPLNFTPIGEEGGPQC